MVKRISRPTGQDAGLPWLLIVPLLFSLGGPAAASAQIRGEVADPEGRPLPGVVVEAWSAYERIAATLTDAHGRFHLISPRVEEVSVLLLRRIGYAATRYELRSGLAGLRIVMRSEPLQVPGLTVQAPRPICPARDSPEARALWDQAAGSYRDAYDLEMSTTGLHTRGTRSTVIMPALDSASAGSLRTYVHGSARRMERARIERDGYARRNTGVTMSGGFWTYSGLERVYPQHFATELFSRNHDLSIHRREGGETTLTFCGRHRRRPYLEGTLTISDGRELVAADWRFVTPGSREEAGGVITFVPLSLDPEHPVLLPAVSTFWRREGEERFYVEHSEYARWVIRQAEEGDGR
jgi:hypothetical protein